MSRNKGYTLVEVISSVVIIGIIILMLNVSLQHHQKVKVWSVYQKRAMVALTSEADLIRSIRGEALLPGRHAFLHAANVLKGLPGSKGYYIVSTSKYDGVARVKISLRWYDRKIHRKELKIYVRP